VSAAEHTGRRTVVDVERIEPEHQILRSHPIRDRRRFGTTRTFAEPAHLGPTLAVPPLAIVAH
jgi:hypothetical protein